MTTATTEKCPNCGIPVGPMPEDAANDEMLCNSCYGIFEQEQAAAQPPTEPRAGESLMEFDYEREQVNNPSVSSLIRWIAELHTELTDAGILLDGVSTETHQQLMIFAAEADRRNQ